MWTATLMALALIALGCASWDTGHTARARAAEAMYCPESEVLMTQVGAYRYRGEGCGRAVTVVCSSSSLQPLCLEEGELAAETAGGESERPLVTTRPPAESAPTNPTPDGPTPDGPSEEPTTPPTDPPRPPSGGPSDIPGPLRALLADRAADILACVGRDVLGVRVTWDAAGAGVIGLVGEHAGSDEEQCVVQVLADSLPRDVGNPVGSGVELVRNPSADVASDAP